MRKRKWGENPFQKVIDLCQTPEVDYMMAYALLPCLHSRIHLKIMCLPLRHAVHAVVSSWGSPLKADLCPCVASQQWDLVSSQLSS